MGGTGASVVLSVDELLALARRLDLPPLPSLGPGPLDSMGQAALHQVLDSADRSLIARGVVDATSGEVLPVIGSLLDIATRPVVLGRVGRRRSGVVVHSFFAAVADVTVEIRPRAFGIHELVPFETDALVERMLHAAGLDAVDGDIAGDGSWHVDFADLTSLCDLLDVGERQAATAELDRLGLPADALVPAAGGWTIATATLTHSPTPTRVDGGEVTTLHVEGGGVLTVTRDETAPEHAVLAWASVESVAGDLLSLLPGA